MLKFVLAAAIIICFTGSTIAQDSVWATLKPQYNRVGKLHRVFFGENYRREWADSTRLPVIIISEIEGGLKPLRLGGGHQTISLRMVSATGKEWVLRNIEKDASVLLPPELRKTFARDVVDDAMSAQHPFASLVVADLAEAVNVPHALPKVGLIKSDTALKEFNKYFAGKICLLEEREPLGNSENSQRMFQELTADNDNAVDAEAFYRARLLDLLIGDWDRHPDQWRWVDTKKGKEKFYTGIPRDRDQAFYLNQGIFPWMASKPWFVPILQGFEGDIKKVKYSLKEGAFLHSRPSMHISLDRLMEITQKFIAALPDTVLYAAIKKLPAHSWDLKHEILFSNLQQRRNKIPQAMREYFRFINHVAEIQLSNKHELINLTDAADDGLLLEIRKLGKKEGARIILSHTYFPGNTKEIRIYTGNGNDSLVADYSSKIKVRIIAGDGEKRYQVNNAGKKISIYDKPASGKFYGDAEKIKIHSSVDSANIAFVPVNRYNILKPLISAGFNRDDGLILGFGLQFIHQGFRKVPYASKNRMLISHSFATEAFSVKYSGEWVHVFGNTDLVANANIFAPENTRNFFGRGNESVFNKTGNHISFYRTRFSLYEFNGGARWRTKNGWSYTVGPAFQHYRFDSLDNKGRFLQNGPGINSYDSLTVSNSKTHAGLMLNLIFSKKNHPVLPSKGYQFNVRVQGLAGMNDYSKSFGQLIPEFVIYAPINKKGTAVIAERIGGGISVGKTAFYQSLFAGGHENLLGYRQYRFAGDQLIYNNLEARIKLANFTGYIIPGEFGMIGFYDVGRVWVKNENSKVWHQGAGGGLYFAPAKIAVISVVAGYSKEGWYPYISIGFRY